jgi:hypothetical protein
MIRRLIKAAFMAWLTSKFLGKSQRARRSYRRGSARR